MEAPVAEPVAITGTAEKERKTLGWTANDLPEKGPVGPVVVSDVQPEEWAARLGVQVGDQLFSVNGTPPARMVRHRFIIAMKARPLELVFHRQRESGGCAAAAGAVRRKPQVSEQQSKPEEADQLRRHASELEAAAAAAAAESARLRRELEQLRAKLSEQQWRETESSTPARGSLLRKASVLSTKENRARSQRSTPDGARPVVISGPGLETLARAVSKSLGCEAFGEAEGPTLSLEVFKSNDPNMRFNWKRIVGRKVIFIFDTVDQSRLFEQLALLQALQGFAVPDGEDMSTKWKSYALAGNYAWGRAAQVTVVLPWFRPCQMERTSRWQLQGGEWTNADAQGEWLDVPCAQYYARLLCTPSSVPPLPGPSSAADGMPLEPLWRPPVELLFVELHEEEPIRHCVSDLGATVRMERFVPCFLDKFKGRSDSPGKADTYVLFPDKGALKRYNSAVLERLNLDTDHILFIKKTRVGEKVGQEQKLFFIRGEDDLGEKTSFAGSDHVLIVDDFTNSGGTLFGAVEIVRKLVATGDSPAVTIFVSHLVASYDTGVVQKFQERLHSLGPTCRFFTTNSIPLTTDMLKSDPQIEVLDISDFIADLVQ